MIGVHRLVLMAFAGPCPSGHETRHFPDFDKTNNRPDNLSWALPSVNKAERRLRHGEDQPSAQLTNDQAKAVFLLRNLFTADELADLFRISRQTVLSIQRRASYKAALDSLPQSSPRLRAWRNHGIEV